MSSETPQKTLACIPEIREAAEFEIKHEMAAIAQACYVGTTPVGAKRRLKLLNNIPALLDLVAWQQEVINDASSEIDHLELCGGVGRKSLDALREQIKEATG